MFFRSKKTGLDQFSNIRKNGIIAIKLKDDDELISVRMTNGDRQVILVTKKGMSIRFNEKDVREMGRNTSGVKGITLNKGDEVVAVDLVEENKYLLIISENGYGKRTPIEEYKVQLRGGKGLKTYNIKKKTGDIISAKILDENDEVILISYNGTIIRLNTTDISIMGRSTQGVTLMRMNDEKVVAVAKYVEDVEEQE